MEITNYFLIGFKSDSTIGNIEEIGEPCDSIKHTI